MKLGLLRSAIRAHKGPVTTRIAFADQDDVGFVLEPLEITKQSLLAALEKAFPDGRTVETNLKLDGSALTREVGGRVPPTPIAGSPAAEEEESSDLDDLLG
jgi:hypothetical protein